MRLSTSALAIAAFFAASIPAVAADLGTEADHQALIKLKEDVAGAIGKRDINAIERHLHKPFSATLVTQDHFSDFSKLTAYFDDLYTRGVPRMKAMSITADADERAQIYQGTFAVAKGSTNEHYELADGRSFDLKGRWTATLVKEGDSWKILAVHSGVNFLDNPVVAMIEKNVAWIAGAAGGVGLLAGFLGGWYARRARQRQ